MKRNAMVWLTALIMTAAFSSQAMAALLGLQVSGAFAPCGGSNLPPPCGAYGGTLIIDTNAAASSSDQTGTWYPLQSASITLNQPTTVISSGPPEIRISNDVLVGINTLDSLFFYVAGAGMEFKINFNSPASTVGNEQLTEANVLALIDSATAEAAWVKYSAPGGGAAQADAQSFSIERINVPEPSALALLGLGLACFAAARRRKQ